MKKNLHRIAIYFLELVFFGIAFIIISTSGEYAYYKFAPMNLWIEYKEVKPTQLTYDYTKPLIFNSIFEVNKKSNLEFVDTLKCNFEDDFGFYSQYVSYGNSIEPRKEIKDVNWTFQGNTPLPPRTCYLDSIIKLKLPYGIEKQQRLIGENFQIK